MRTTERENEPENEPDEVLMERYAAGDVASFEELFRRYEPRAYRFFLSRTASPERASDLYQELFLRIHRARFRYDPARPFKPWFFRIASRLLVDDRRLAFRNREQLVDEDELGGEPARVEQAMAGRERLALAMDALSESEWHVLVSTRVEGSDYADVASDLGKSVEAVRQMASRAVRRLRRVIGAAEAEGAVAVGAVGPRSGRWSSGD